MSRLVWTAVPRKMSSWGFQGKPKRHGWTLPLAIEMDRETGQEGVASRQELMGSGALTTDHSAAGWVQAYGIHVQPGRLQC
jgi:hypothetical protein